MKHFAHSTKGRHFEKNKTLYRALTRWGYTNTRTLMYMIHKYTAILVRTLGLNCALKRSKEYMLGLLGSKYYQNEEKSETNPLVYGRKRENQRYQCYQASNVLHFL